MGKPLLSDREKFSGNRFIYPVECRERGVSYKSKMVAKIAYQVEDSPVKYEYRQIGHLPVMVKSNRCHLEGLTPAQLVQKKEDSEELGGYFIVQRRNHVSSW